MSTFRSLPMTSSALPSPIWGRRVSLRPPILNLGGAIQISRRRGFLAMKVCSDSDSTNEEINVDEDEKSERYSRDMTVAMGTALEYRHELGMNYDFISPGIIVGSCLQTPSDVDTLRNMGVNTILCLQQNPDLEYFGVDIDAIREYAMKCGDIEHIRAEIRDFDEFDLRSKLPTVVRELYKAINRNGGITYIQCTAGLGRAPSVALAYMFWVEGCELSEGNQLLQTRRPCCPKLEAIKNATIDMLMDLSKSRVTLTWKGGNCSSVEVSGLDIGWGQCVPLEFNEKEGLWILEKDLLEGRYEYKYIVDGEWMCNEEEPMTHDVYCNNYVEIYNDDARPETEELKIRLWSETADLTENERAKIRKILESDDQ